MEIVEAHSVVVVVFVVSHTFCVCVVSRVLLFSSLTKLILTLIYIFGVCVCGCCLRLRVD